MRFNHFLRFVARSLTQRLLVVPIFVAPLLSGCFLFNDSPDAGSLGQVGPPQPGCLNDFPDQMAAYFDGNLQDDSQIEATWECAAQGLESFLLLTRGSEAGLYAPHEIQEFLNRYFSRNQQITGELMTQAMKLKQGALGGRTDRLPKDEVRRFIEFIRILKRHAVAIKHIMPLDGSRVSRLSDGQIERALGAMRTAAEELGQFFVSQGADYSLDDAQALLLAFERNFPETSKPGSGIRLLREQIPLFKVLKRIFINSDGEMIRKGEWAKFLLFGARIHAVFFEFTKQDQSRGEKDWFSEEGLDRLQVIANRAIDILADAAAFHPAGVVDPRHLSDLVRVLATMKQDRSLDSIEMTDTVSHLIAKLLVAKQFLFGGPLYEWDMGHAVLLKPFIETVKRPAWIVYNRIIEGKDQIRDMDEVQFQSLLRESSQAVFDVIASFVSLRNARQFTEFQDQIEKLVFELRPLFKDEEEKRFVTEAIAFFFSTKGALQGPPYNRVTPGDWAPMLRRLEPLARAYLHSLRKGDPTLPEDERNIRRLWPAVDAAIETLASAAGARESGLRVEEILSLIDSIPTDLRDEVFPDARDLPFIRNLMPQLYILKASLLGGQNVTMTAGEVTNLRTVLFEGKEALLVLLKYLPFDFEEFKVWPADRAEQLAATIETSGRRIADVLPPRGGVEYPLSHLATLVGLFRERFPQTDWGKIEANIPLFGAIKSVLIRPPHTRILAHDWRDVFVRLTRWGSDAIRLIHLFSNAEGLSYGRDLNRFSTVFYSVLDLLRSAATGRGGSDHNVILFSEWNRLFDEVYRFAEAEEIEMPLTKSTVVGFFPSAVKRLLSGMRWGNTGRQATGLRIEAVDYVKAKFDHWRQGALTLERLYLDLGGEAAIHSDGYNRATLLSHLDRMRREAALLPSASRSIREYTIDRHKEVINQLNPLYLGKDRVVSMVYDNRREHLYSFSNMANMNTHWILIEVFLQGYSDDRTRAQNLTGLTKGELFNFATDTFDLLRELKFGNPDQGPADLAAQRFMEANLFLHSSVGDQYLGKMETIEYLAFLLSAQELSKAVHDEVIQVCPGGDSDYAGKPTFQVECFRRQFFNTRSFHGRFTRYLPRMAYYFTTMQGEVRKKFERDLEQASIPARQAHLPVDSSHIQNFVMIPLYVESMFKRFDTNRTGVLSIQEALQAYPLVCPLILEITNGRFEANCSLGESGFVEAVFGYLLKFGAPPRDDASDFFGKVEQTLAFLNWNITWWMTKNTPDAFNLRFTVDRARIMSIVGALAVTSSEATSTAGVVRPNH